MTVKEFNDEFDIQYNAVVGASNAALDLYEKSVYLTRAQLEIIKNFYDETSNPKVRGFEATEKRRMDLKELITTWETSMRSTSNDRISDDSVMIHMPSKYMFIIHEQITANVKGCKKHVPVVPVTHDEYNTQINNPFKKPTPNRAWRMDYQSIHNQPVVEVIYPFDKNFTYKARYIRYPKPIILVDLEDEFPNQDLSIDGETGVSECQLSIELHPQILNRAIELAQTDYNPYELETKVNIDQRQE